MPVSGLGERGSRLRRIARALEPAPAIPPFYVQSPDEDEIRAIGWYMRCTRKGPPVFLGHSAAAAEAWLRIQIAEQANGRPKRRRKTSSA